VAGDNGTILRTTDGGATWTVQPTDTKASLWGISFIDTQTGFVVGDQGAVLRTADGGITWKKFHDNDRALGGLHAVAFTDANRGTAVGGMGIWHTADGGVTWDRQFTSSVGRMLAISFTDANTAVAVGEKNVIVRTATGGEPPAPQ
jgi:photosystem II stability/assembly factor-like uncharacterized protein